MRECDRLPVRKAALVRGRAGSRTPRAQPDRVDAVTQPAGGTGAWGRPAPQAANGAPAPNGLARPRVAGTSAGSRTVATGVHPGQSRAAAIAGSAGSRAGRLHVLSTARGVPRDAEGSGVAGTQRRSPEAEPITSPTLVGLPSFEGDRLPLGSVALDSRDEAGAALMTESRILGCWAPPGPGRRGHPHDLRGPGPGPAPRWRIICPSRSLHEARPAE